MTDATKIFAWLREPPETRDASYAKAISDYLLETWREVRDRIGASSFDPVLGEVRAGRFERRAAGAWTQTNGEHEGDLVNLTLEVEAEELSLNVVGWFDPQLEKVERWLRSRVAKDFLRTLEGWDLLIFIRKAHVGPSGTAIFRGAEGELRERLPLAQTSPASVSITLDGIRPRLDSSTEKLALHIRRGWSPKVVGTPAQLASAIAPEVERWLDPIQKIRLS